MTAKEYNSLKPGNKIKFFVGDGLWIKGKVLRIEDGLPIVLGDGQNPKVNEVTIFSIADIRKVK